jgi:DNA-binding MarR family transcriptional regulator
MADPTPPEPGRYAYDGLDRTLHEKGRLGILTALVTRPEGVTFTELARMCALTEGNLSRHLDRLANDGLVDVHKGYDRRRPLTTCTLTALGRRRFRDYLTQLEQVLRDAATEEDAEVEEGQIRPGLAGA